MKFALEMLLRLKKKSPAWVALMKIFLVHFYLCEEPFGYKCSFRLFSVINQLKPGTSIMGVALAETLISLDSFKAGKITTRFFPGSPLLLQIWLMEKLGILVEPSVSFRQYHPMHLRGRISRTELLQRPQYPCAWWEEALSTIECENVTWKCP